MLALPRGGTTEPTTPLLRFMIAYAHKNVNMRTELLLLANRRTTAERSCKPLYKG